jgi:hypothetical protein
MILIPIIQVFIVASYLFFVYQKYGVLPSISDSWYRLKEENWHSLFTIFIWGITLSLLPLITYSPWFFASAGLLGFVGVATAFKEDGIDKAHGAAAIGGIVFALFALLTQGIWLPTVATVLICGYLRLKKINNLTFWVEIVGIVIIIIGVFDLTV